MVGSSDWNSECRDLNRFQDPLELVAAVGDPMQIVVAGMAIAASVRVWCNVSGGNANVSSICLD